MGKRSIANCMLAVVVLAAGLVAAMRWPGIRHIDWFGAALLGVAALALAARERWPVPVLAVNVLAATLFHGYDYAHVAIAPATMVALFTVAAEGTRRRTILTGAAVFAIAGTIIVTVPHHQKPSVASWSRTPSRPRCSRRSVLSRPAMPCSRRASPRR